MAYVVRISTATTTAKAFFNGTDNFNIEVWPIYLVEQEGTRYWIDTWIVPGTEDQLVTNNH